MSSAIITEGSSAAGSACLKPAVASAPTHGCVAVRVSSLMWMYMTVCTDTTASRCQLMLVAAKCHNIQALLPGLLVLTVGKGADFIVFAVINKRQTSNTHALAVLGSISEWASFQVIK